MKQIAMLAAAMVAILIALNVAVVPSAEAATLSAATEKVSLPYVTDVNPTKHGYVATVECASGASKLELKVTQDGKAVKVHRYGKRLWTVPMKAKKYYKLSVRAKGGKWKSIGYRVY